MRPSSSGRGMSHRSADRSRRAHAAVGRRSLAGDARAGPDSTDAHVPRTRCRCVATLEALRAALAVVGLAQRTTPRERSSAIPLWAVAAALAVGVEAPEGRRAGGSVGGHDLRTVWRRGGVAAERRRHDALPNASRAPVARSAGDTRITSVAARARGRARRAIRRLNRRTCRRTRGGAWIRRRGPIEHIGREDREWFVEGVGGARVGIRSRSGIDRPAGGQARGRRESRKRRQNKPPSAH